MKQDGRSLLVCVAILLIPGAIPTHAQQQPPDDRDLSLRKLVTNIVDDQKVIWVVSRAACEAEGPLDDRCLHRRGNGACRGRRSASRPIFPEHDGV
jgi:hypothetical protein